MKDILKAACVSLVLGATIALAPQAALSDPLTSGVSFAFSDTQSSNLDPATLQSVIVNGETFTELVAPSAGYSITDPADRDRVRLRNTGDTLQRRIDVAGGDVAAGIASFESLAAPFFSSRDLNLYVRIDSPNAIAGNPPPAGTFTQTLDYATPISLDRGGFVVVTERGGNNDFFLRVFNGGTQIGTGFVPEGTNNCPGGGSYLNTGRVYDNGQSICAAVFPMSDFGTTGTFDRVQLVCSDSDGVLGAGADCGDGKIFVIQSDDPVAVDDEDRDNTPGLSVSLDVLDNDQRGDGATPAPGEVTVDLDTGTPGVQTTFVAPGEGTWTYDAGTGEVTFTPTGGFTGDPTPIDYELTEIATLETDTATITIDYNAPPVADDDSSTGNTPGINVVLDILANDQDEAGGTPDPADVTVDLDPGTPGVQTTLAVTGEGEWTYNPATGEVTFDPEPTFFEDPTDITYELTETATGLTDTAIISVDYLATGVTLTKSVERVEDTNASGTFGDAGDTVFYDFTIENTGEVSLAGLSVDDARLGMTDVAVTPADLAPGFTGTIDDVAYVLTDLDIAAAEVENTASVEGTAVATTGGGAPDPGTPLGLPPVTDTSDAGTEPALNPDGTTTTVADPPNTDTNGTPGDDADEPTVLEIPDAVFTPEITLVKSLSSVEDSSGNGTLGDAGDTFIYEMTLENTGNTALADITVADALLGITDADPTPTALMPGETATLTGLRYVLTAADVAAGQVENTATATGTPVAAPGGVPAPGSPLGLADVTDTSDTGTEPALNPDATPVTVADPGATDTNGTPGDDGDEPTVVEIPDDALAPSLALVKSVTALRDTNRNGILGDAGDRLVYGFTVENTGTTALAGITVTDPLLGLTDVPVTPANLMPGETATIDRAVYTITEGDADAGRVTNTATATGTPVEAPGGVPDPGTPLGLDDVNDISDTGTEPALDDDGAPVTVLDPGATDTNDTPGDDGDEPTVTLLPSDRFTPSISLIKSFAAVDDTNGDQVLGNAGDTFTYSFSVENTGDTALAGITISDPLIGLTDAAVTPATLMPGETATLTGVTYVVTDADMAAGAVENTATATATPVGLSGGAPDPDLPLGLDPVTDISDTGTEPETEPDGTPITVPDPNGTDTNGDTGDDTDEPTVTRVPVAPSGASLTGFVFFDEDGNGGYQPGTDEPRGGYLVILRNGDGEEVARTTTADDGSYTFEGFPVGNDYVVEFFDTETGDPDNPVLIGSIGDLDFIDDPVQTDINQPIDPAGTFYDSVTGRPIAGVQVRMVDGAGRPLPAACLAAGQQPQTTGARGTYEFLIQAGADAACPVGTTTYQIEVIGYPADYVPAVSATYPPEAGPLVGATCGTLVDAVPGGACQVSASVTPPPAGTTQPYYLTFVIGAGEADIVNNHIPLDPLPLDQTGLVIAKAAGVRTVVLGDVVPYTVTVTNNRAADATPLTVIDRLPQGLVYLPGSGIVDGVATEPAVAGRLLTFAGLTASANATFQITYSVRVTGSAPIGDLTNFANLVNPVTGNTVAPEASATVVRQPEHIFDCSDVIGKVFDDRDMDGYQDDGAEPGLPGVRVVTPRGTIITTDEHGRYHIPCAELPSATGANFTLKVDERSLPTGYRLTTENPRVERLTAGKFAKMNFGASIGRIVDIDLSSRAFNGLQPVDGFEQAVARLIDRIKDDPSMLRIAYYDTGEDRRIVQRRLDAVEAIVRDRWRVVGRYKLNIERTIKRVQ